MKQYAIIIGTMCGPICSIITSRNNDNDIEPELFVSVDCAKLEIDNAREDCNDADDWDIEEVIVETDIMTIVSSGESFNWREGR